MRIIHTKNEPAQLRRRALENRIRSRLPETPRRTEWHTVRLDSDWEEKQWRGQNVRVFTGKIQRALDEHVSVEIPYSAEPVYIDRTLLLNSGNALKVHPETRIVMIGDRLMLRNRNIVEGHFGRVRSGASSDRNLWICGGIWECPDSQMYWFGAARDFRGCDSMFMLSNVIDVSFEKVTVRDSRRMALQIGNCEGFVVQDVCMADSGIQRDGIHVEGPAAYGCIRRISGRSGDDFAALNAWDWEDYSLTFGEIRDVIIEDIDCDAGHLWAEMRILAGVKRFPNGEIEDCGISNLLVRNVHGLHTIKMYHQKDPRTDAASAVSVAPGAMYDLFFEDMTFTYFPTREYHTPKQAALEILADVCGLHMKNVCVQYPLRSPEYDDYTLLGVGPIPQPNERDGLDGTATSFVPETAFRVREVTLENICDSAGRVDSLEKLIRERGMSVDSAMKDGLHSGFAGFGTVDEFYW